MQDAASGLPRTLLLGNWVNEDEKKDRGCYVPDFNASARTSSLYVSTLPKFYPVLLYPSTCQSVLQPYCNRARTEPNRARLTQPKKH